MPPVEAQRKLTGNGGGVGGAGRARAGRARKSMLNSSSKSERVDAVTITSSPPLRRSRWGRVLHWRLVGGRYSAVVFFCLLTCWLCVAGSR